MITDLTSSILYMCPECSRVTTKKISAFDFSKKGGVKFCCTSNECKAEAVRISPAKEKYRINVECPICGEDHTFFMSRKSFWEKDFFILNCPELMFGILFFGKDEKKIYSEYTLQNELAAGLVAKSSEDEDEDIYLLFDIVERINELSHVGKIECKCSSKNIYIGIDAKSVILECRDCGRQQTYEVSEEFLQMLETTDKFIIT